MFEYNKVIHCIIVVTLLVTNLISAEPKFKTLDSKQKKKLEDAKILLVNKKFREALVKVKSVQKGIYPDQSLIANALFYKIYNLSGHAKDVLQILAKKDYLNPYKRKFFEIYLEKGNSYIALMQFETAEKHFNDLATEEQGKSLENQVFAVHGHGKALLGQKKYNEALKSFSFVSHNLKVIKAKNGGYALTEDLKYLSERNSKFIKYIKNLLKKLSDEEFKKLVGEAFILYRDAEVLRRRNRNADARQLFKKLVAKHPETIYAQAAKVYAAKCLIMTNATENDFKKVIIELENFIESSEHHGLYVGEALHTIAKIYLDEFLDDKNAKLYLSRLSNWIASVRAKDQLKIEVKDLNGVTATALEIVVNESPEYSRFDFWGKRKRIVPPPEKLVNRLTCDWYLNDLEESGAKYLGFINIFEGENDKASNEFKKILQLDNSQFKGDISEVQNDYSRLMFAVKKSYFYAYPEELELYEGKLRLGVLLGDFYYITEQYQLSQRISQKLFNGDYGKLSAKRKIYPIFLYGCSIYKTKGTDEALKVYSTILKSPYKMFTTTRAAYAFGNIALLKDEKKYLDVGVKTLEKLINEKKAGEYYAKAYIALAMYHVRFKDFEKAVTVLDQYPAKDAKWFPVVAEFKKQFLTLQKGMK